MNTREFIVKELTKLIASDKTPASIKQQLRDLLANIQGDAPAPTPVDPTPVQPTPAPTPGPIPAPADGKLRTMFLFKAPATGLPSASGAYASTLSWWSTKWTEAQRNLICAFLKDSGSNCIVTLIRCGETNMSRAEIMAAIKGAEGARFARYGLQHVPIYLSDDDSASFNDLAGHPGWIADLSAAALASPTPVPMILIGLEIGESSWWTNDRAGWMAQEFRGHLSGKIKVGAHLSWPAWQKNSELVVQADVIALEWPWDPHAAASHNDADFKAVLTAALAKAGGKQLVAAEFHIDGGSDQAKRWGKMALDAGCAGAWTGF